MEGKEEKHTMEKIPRLYSAPNCKHELLRLRDRSESAFVTYMRTHWILRDM